MEFIKGKELKNFFDANERFELKEAVRIMCELLDALEFAHEAGIVHRDIKPANVMLDSQARVKLADFGVARVTDDRSSAEHTQAGTMVGTPAYMSPEQITGGNIDRRTDVFSAGIILYQFLTGEKPFTGSGAWTIAKKIIQDHPPVAVVDQQYDFAAVRRGGQQGALQERRPRATSRRKRIRRRAQARARRQVRRGRFRQDGGRPDGRHAARCPSQRRRWRSPSRTPPRAPPPRSSQEVELEFWRAIKDGNDPDDFELYVQQFPTGIYAALAKRKIAKLRGVAPEETGAKAKAAPSRRRRKPRKPPSAKPR